MLCLALDPVGGIVARKRQLRVLRLAGLQVQLLKRDESLKRPSGYNTFGRRYVVHLNDSVASGVNAPSIGASTKAEVSLRPKPKGPAPRRRPHRYRTVVKVAVAGIDARDILDLQAPWY
ncbi:hypothetical protein HMPREF1624_06887 [Sporothrix schenckii ATCC 58251]|uniref:Uncharacterized protein n=1 Tax=Sporothrix schenckii (strain ATCC 58251 / de Perez 2211183) TaxID=1391915 RepID=U7PM00_SPOS1|nr:hypothetical protein HMPREF1624_06887 [Sporothrix schenckii ATCC 58251]